MGTLLERVKEQLGGKIVESHEYRGDTTVVLAREDLLEAARQLKDHAEMAFDMLVDLTVVDYPEEALRFEVVYHLLSIGRNQRLRVKVRVAEQDAEVPSVCGLWPVANWLEREAWDMFGVRFAGHPELKRILMYEEFEGHPLRKDYPYSKRQPLYGPQN